MKIAILPASNAITLNRNSTREDRSKYLARLAVSNNRHMITLREARENVRVTTKKAAEAAGITERTLKKWEIDCGRANTFAIDRLCRYYGISMDHVHPGKEADLLAARRAVSTSDRQVIKLEDVLVALKKMGRDTIALESFLEELDKSWEAETKNALAIGVAKALETSVM
ncbi:helix-turn-helix transcriptional regulator [Paenibacillus sp. FSL R10-2778]|jgi:DNA-binding transcriptional regulator YiaG|uniref:helix-turn-helix transcriptional regulator n=1 Tax=Paenibacillus sp. FSL R10-2778 TaxID=2954659 RepID=UPI0031590D7D